MEVHVFVSGSYLPAPVWMSPLTHTTSVGMILLRDAELIFVNVSTFPPPHLIVKISYGSRFVVAVVELVSIDISTPLPSRL